MKYLSSEQALEDLANFITTYSADNSLGDAKWIAFGGSYPGRQTDFKLCGLYLRYVDQEFGLSSLFC